MHRGNEKRNQILVRKTLNVWEMKEQKFEGIKSISEKGVTE
jgi:hypothetical protein